MVKKLLHLLIIIVSFTCVILFAGCMKFENSFDLLTSQPSQDFDSASSTRPQDPNYNESTSSEAPSADESDPSETSADDPSADGETTTAPQNDPSENTTQIADIPENNEYDILKTGEFSFLGTMLTGSDEMEANISIGNGKIYFVTDMDGFELGLYVEDKKTYIYAPQHKKYLKMNSVVAKILQIDPETFIEMTESLGFDKLPPLSSAESIKDGSVKGVSCKVFTFKNAENTSMKAYMKGTRLLKIEYTDKNGAATNSISFTSITAGFPKMPPDGYEEMGYFEFFKLIAGDS